MQTLQATKVPIDVDALAEAARKEPVTVMSGETEAFVVVDPAEFRRLQAADHERRKEAGRKLLETMNHIHRDIAARASPEEIEEILRELEHGD